MQSNQNLTFLFLREFQANAKIRMKMKGTQNSQYNLEREDPCCTPDFANFKTYYKAIITKTVWYWKWNRIENSETKPSHLWLVDFWQRCQDKWYWGNWMPTCKRMKLDHYSILHIKNFFLSQLYLFLLDVNLINLVGPSLLSETRALLRI